MKAEIRMKSSSRQISLVLLPSASDLASVVARGKIWHRCRWRRCRCSTRRAGGRLLRWRQSLVNSYLL